MEVVVVVVDVFRVDVDAEVEEVVVDEKDVSSVIKAIDSTT
jgi:hypothetical protein